MSDPARKVKITRESLERAQRERSDAKARMERAFFAAASAPAPDPSVRSELDRTIRTLALGAAAACAFAPWALLAAEPPGARTALRALGSVLLLTLGPALLSARAERSHEAEDMPRARAAHRFSPLAVAVVCLLAMLFPFAARWGVVQAALAVQFPLAFFLHIPRVRALHLLVVGFGALASLALDDRALPGVLLASPLVLLAQSLDRGLHVRSASREKTAPDLELPLGAAALVSALAGAVFLLAYALLPRMERNLPVLPTVHAERGLAPEKTTVPFIELLVAVGACVLLLVLYHWISEKRRKKPEAPLAMPLAAAGTALEPLDELSGAEDERWPRGPRRALVRRYLEHLARLAHLGIARRPAEGALDVVGLVAARRETARDAEARLARAFHLARYSAAPVSEAQRREADEAARSVEDGLTG